MKEIQAVLIALALAGVTRGNEPTSGTVALALEMGSPIVTLNVHAKDGTVRPTRFLVDTGGGALMLTEAVAMELGLDIHRDEVFNEGSESFAQMETPIVEIDGMPLDLTDARCAAVLDRKSVIHGGTAQGFLPGHILSQHHVIFDYPAGRFTLARPDALEPRGEVVAALVREESGFPRIELEVGGDSLGFLLDTGASFTMISRTLLDRWKAADATLATMTGAVGDANMVGGPMESAALLTRVPAMKWGPFTLSDVAAVSRPEGVFEKWMSGMMTGPIVGAIGGNVLRNFRVEIDYAQGKAYLETSAKSFGTTIDAVGLVLSETKEGGHRVDAIAEADGKPLCEGVQVGDILVAVDGRSLEGLRHRQVMELLRGAPGAARMLAFERDGKPVEQEVRVRRCLGSGGNTEDRSQHKATLSFLSASGLVFIELTPREGPPLLALLDTGASASAIDTRRASGWKSIGSSEVVGTTGTLQVEMVEVAGLRFGSLALPDLHATRRDLSGLLAPSGRTVDMILGSDAFAHLALTLDFVHHTVELATTAEMPKETSTPMTLDNGIPTVPARIGGLDLSLRIDTGASLFETADVYVNIPMRVWNALRSKSPELVPLKSFKGTGADGKEVDLPVARVPDARIGSMHFDQVFVIVQPEAGYFADPKALGFVGNNYLEKLGSVTLDYGAGVLASTSTGAASSK